MEVVMRVLGIGLLAGTVTIAASTAYGDGMPERYARPVHIAQPACANFGGLYIGGSAGWTHYNASVEDQNNFVSFPFAIGGTTTYAGTGDSFAGGVQAGYNLQRHCTVFGLEADWTWTDAHVSSTAHPNFLGAPAAFGRVDSTLHSFGTLRTRTGIVVDNTLLYVTGGLAWLDAHHSAANSFPGLMNEHGSLGDNTRWGWVGGVGVEHALSSNISIKSEALYITTMDNDERVQANPVINRCTTNGALCDFKTTDSAWIARVGVNFQFNREPDLVPLK
jgi:outer membrane immunogenic protein